MAQLIRAKRRIVVAIDIASQRHPGWADAMILAALDAFPDPRPARFWLAPEARALFEIALKSEGTTLAAVPTPPGPAPKRPTITGRNR